MKSRISNIRNQGLTRTDVIVLIFVLIFLAFIVFPFFIPDNPRLNRAPRIQCVSNLKQVAVAARIWEGDHQGEYPMSVSVTNGGAKELIAAGNVAGCLRVMFQDMSNELSATKILICPADTDHTIASNFSTLKNSNVSYFINPDASETYPQMIMFGDDNLATNGVPLKSGLVDISSNTRTTWTSARHKNCGNIAFADGSVAEENNDSLTNWTGPANLAIP